MKDEDLDELVGDGMILDYEYMDLDENILKYQNNPFDSLTLTFPNGKKMRIESLSEYAPSVLMVNLE